MTVKVQTTHKVAIPRADECNMTPNPPSWVSWLLLASYALLLGVGGVGLLVSVNNFWEEEPLPPTLPPGLEESDRYRYKYGSPERIAYDKYIDASREFARATSDARLYVAVPCSVCVVVAALVLVGGHWSRQFFSFTFSLYNSVGVWFLTLSWTVVYQSEVAWNKQMNLDATCWVLVFHVVLLLLLSAQIMVCAWELLRQKAGWPTNWRNLFTLEAVLVVGRVVFTVNTFMSLKMSVMFRGYIYNGDDPRTRWPLVFSLVSYSAICYSAVATAETILSMLVGKLHSRMTIVTSLLSTLCCITVAVLNSTEVMRAIVPSFRDYFQQWNAGVRLSVITLVHMVCCLLFSTKLRSSPDSLREFLKLSVPSCGNGAVNKQPLTSEHLQKNEENHKVLNRISAAFSLISIGAITAVWSFVQYREWGLVVVLCANCASLGRTLPPSVMEIMFDETENKSVNQKLLAMSLEAIPLLVGAIATCVGRSNGIQFIIGVVNITFFVFQVCICVQLLREKINASMAEKEKCSAETEKFCVKGKEEEQSPTDPSA